VFASKATSWNSLFQAFLSPIFYHPFKIIFCLFFNSFHALLNHSQIYGFKIAHFQVNSGIFAIFNLLFDDPNYLVVEHDLECMLEWALQNNINWLENIGM
jgi:hypothetical protein